MKTESKKETIDLVEFAEKLKEKGRTEEKQMKTTWVLPGTPRIVQLLMKHSHGLIKKEQEATQIVLLILGLCIIVSLFVAANAIKGPYIPKGVIIDPIRGLP